MNNKIAELTIPALLLGIFLSLLMCAANAYLGLYAGMTVSASIPAAVVSMGLLRGILRRGTILENNIVQTAASAGESLAAGIIFTMPALIIAGVWVGFDYWPTTLVALLGGALGVLFMIPLRRVMIVEPRDLVYPEGIACAEVLKTGEHKGPGIMCVFSGLGLGVIFKFSVGAVSMIRGVVQGAFRLGSTAFYFGSDMSVALIGVGYIIGFNVAVLVILGGLIGWLIAIPAYLQINGLPSGDLVGVFGKVWSTQIRYLGVGAMIIGGLTSIFKVRHSMIKGFRDALFGFRSIGVEVSSVERDLPSRHIFVGLALVTIPVFILYAIMTKSMITGLIAAVIMIIAAFFFVAVSSYIVGLVGSSNNPVSGMVIVTVIFASLLLLLFGQSGSNGLLAALVVAGVVCCAACTAGDVSQDLKTGHLLGATPRNQQIAQLIGVGFAAFILAPILTILHRAYGIGTGEPGALSAPQASLFAGIVGAIFGGRPLPWEMVGIGAIIGVALLTLDEYLRRSGSAFRTHVMPVAVGIYLPLALSVPIALGGTINAVVNRFARRKFSGDPGKVNNAMQRGVLFSSGLVAGEAITGIIIAVLIVGGFALPVPVFDSALVSLAAFALAIALLIGTAMRREKNGTR